MKALSIILGLLSGMTVDLADGIEMRSQDIFQSSDYNSLLNQTNASKQQSSDRSTIPTTRYLQQSDASAPANNTTVWPPVHQNGLSGQHHLRSSAATNSGDGYAPATVVPPKDPIIETRIVPNGQQFNVLNTQSGTDGQLPNGRQLFNGLTVPPGTEGQLPLGRTADADRTADYDGADEPPLPPQQQQQLNQQQRQQQQQPNRTQISGPPSNLSPQTMQQSTRLQSIRPGFQQKGMQGISKAPAGVRQSQPGTLLLPASFQQTSQQKAPQAPLGGYRQGQSATPSGLADGKQSRQQQTITLRQDSPSSQHNGLFQWRQRQSKLQSAGRNVPDRMSQQSYWRQEMPKISQDNTNQLNQGNASQVAPKRQSARKPALQSSSVYLPNYQNQSVATSDRNQWVARIETQPDIRLPASVPNDSQIPVLVIAPNPMASQTVNVSPGTKTGQSQALQRQTQNVPARQSSSFGKANQVGQSPAVSRLKQPLNNGSQATIQNLDGSVASGLQSTNQRISQSHDVVAVKTKPLSQNNSQIPPAHNEQKQNFGQEKKTRGSARTAVESAFGQQNHQNDHRQNVDSVQMVTARSSQTAPKAISGNFSSNIVLEHNNSSQAAQPAISARQSGQGSSATSLPSEVLLPPPSSTTQGSSKLASQGNRSQSANAAIIGSQSVAPIDSSHGLQMVAAATPPLALSQPHLLQNVSSWNSISSLQRPQQLQAPLQTPKITTVYNANNETNMNAALTVAANTPESAPNTSGQTSAAADKQADFPLRQSSLQSAYGQQPVIQKNNTDDGNRGKQTQQVLVLRQGQASNGQQMQQNASIIDTSAKTNLMQPASSQGDLLTRIDTPERGPKVASDFESIMERINTLSSQIAAQDNTTGNITSVPAVETNGAGSTSAQKTTDTKQSIGSQHPLDNSAVLQPRKPLLQLSNQNGSEAPSSPLGKSLTAAASHKPQPSMPSRRDRQIQTNAPSSNRGVGGAASTAKQSAQERKSQNGGLQTRISDVFLDRGRRPLHQQQQTNPTLPIKSAQPSQSSIPASTSQNMASGAAAAIPPAQSVNTSPSNNPLSLQAAPHLFPPSAGQPTQRLPANTQVAPAAQATGLLSSSPVGQAIGPARSPTLNPIPVAQDQQPPPQLGPIVPGLSFSPTHAAQLLPLQPQAAPNQIGSPAVGSNIPATVSPNSNPATTVPLAIIPGVPPPPMPTALASSAIALPQLISQILLPQNMPSNEFIVVPTGWIDMAHATVPLPPPAVKPQLPVSVPSTPPPGALPTTINQPLKPAASAIPPPPPPVPVPAPPPSAPPESLRGQLQQQTAPPVNGGPPSPAPLSPQVSLTPAPAATVPRFPNSQPGPQGQLSAGSAQPLGEAAGPPTCNSDACIEAGTTIMTHIDRSVDPCDNFYRFACGKYIANNRIPENAVEFGHYAMANERITRRMQGLLSGDIKVNVRSTAIEKAKTMYRSCMNTNALFLAKAKFVADAILALRSFGHVQPGPTAPEFAQLLTTFASSFAFHPLFYLYIDESAANASKHQFHLGISPPALSSGFFRNEAAHQEALEGIQAYINGTWKLVQEEAGASCPLLGDLKAPTIIAISRKHAEIIDSAAVASDESEEEWTLTQLQERIPITDWNSYLRQMMPAAALQAAMTSKIAVKQVQSKLQFMAFLREQSPKLLMQYVKWQLIAHLAPYLDERFRLLNLALAKPALERPVVKDRSLACTAIVIELLPAPTSSLYVSRFASQDEKETVAAMAHEVRNALVTTLKQLDWIDDAPTKQAAIEKIQKTTIRVSHPDSARNRVLLDDSYKDLQFSSRDGFLEMALKTRLWHMQHREFAKIAQAVDPTDWADESLGAVAERFDHGSNTITIRAGMLQEPYFNLLFPRVMNYGSVGTMIGRALVHQFDSKGKQYDKDGNVRNWWSPGAKAAYDQIAKCFVNQYNSFVIPGTNQTIDGQRTFDYNLAENAGVRLAYLAYEMSLSKLPPTDDDLKFLPGTNLTNDQAFFVASAIPYCAITRPETIVQRLRTSKFSPWEFSVLGAMSNNDDFARAFECAKGTRMNPSKSDKTKCVMF